VYPTGGYPHPSSSKGYPVPSSSVVYPTGGYPHPSGSVIYPTGGYPHPSSSKGYPTGGYSHPSNSTGYTGYPTTTQPPYSIVTPPSTTGYPHDTTITITTTSTSYSWVPCSTPVGQSGYSTIFSTFLTPSYTTQTLTLTSTIYGCAGKPCGATPTPEAPQPSSLPPVIDYSANVPQPPYTPGAQSSGEASATPVLGYTTYPQPSATLSLNIPGLPVPSNCPAQVVTVTVTISAAQTPAGSYVTKTITIPGEAGHDETYTVTVPVPTGYSNSKTPDAYPTGYPSHSIKTHSSKPTGYPSHSIKTYTPKPTGYPSESIKTYTLKPTGYPSESVKTYTPKPTGYPSQSPSSSPSPSPTGYGYGHY
jgi:hypothetical protein